MLLAAMQIMQILLWSQKILASLGLYDDNCGLQQGLQI